MTPTEIIHLFEEKLGNTDFIVPSTLVSVGLFGSLAAVRGALSRGDLPSLRVSRHRVLIPKSAVIEHIRKNLSVSG